ncbi:FRIGIDA-like protein 4a [Dorcoceras hygrometricum]|uniref:FRIGIDA-like protein 4a n=1 Tax=Dorcoceras hygrometricum TaxID=472368 RepID=A0A2Z7AE25_9LAMI|nr:FRIGIDA-like protein 4a [Dorcoceras hygrometricum]
MRIRPPELETSICDMKYHVSLITTLVATRAWLRPVSRGKRHFTVDCGRQRQSGPRPETGFLRQPALEGLKRSARMDSPVKIVRKKFRRHVAAAAAAHMGGGGGFLEEGRGGGQEIGLGFSCVVIVCD